MIADAGLKINPPADVRNAGGSNVHPFGWKRGMRRIDNVAIIVDYVATLDSEG